jgi:glutamine cyclotransferase
VLALLAAAVACNGDDDANREPIPAPPGMELPPSTNADATPPAIPFDRNTPVLTARALQRWPHDTGAYTQGLLVHEGRLLESTGLEGRSTAREVALESGAVRRSVALPPTQFGEGMAAIGPRVWQLTWKDKVGYVRDARTLAVVDTVRYEGEGWGLATDGAVLYLSDGSSRIRVMAPDAFTVQRTIQVTEAGQPVHMLNELEWVRGELWANVYMTDYIARIDPATGRVVGWVWTGALLTTDERAAVKARGGVPNGIAYDPARERVLVTGKLWPAIFAIDLRDIQGMP